MPGYLERDPREDQRAQHLASLSFEEALGMANHGCQLVQRRAISVAAKANLPLVVRSLEERAPVSVVSCIRESENVEARDEVVAAPACSRDRRQPPPEGMVVWPLRCPKPVQLILLIVLASACFVFFKLTLAMVGVVVALAVKEFYRVLKG